MRARDINEQLQTSGADVLSSRKKIRKSLGGVVPPPPSLYAQGLKSQGMALFPALFVERRVYEFSCNDKAQRTSVLLTLVIKHLING